MSMHSTRMGCAAVTGGWHDQFQIFGRDARSFRAPCDARLGMGGDLGARRGRSPGPDLLHLFERWPRIFAYDSLAGSTRRRVGTAYVGAAASRKSHLRRQALL